ncbi:uncharacterized protein VSU04_008162 isoform 1-T1 [Chlamydotis macqueenii]
MAQARGAVARTPLLILLLLVTLQAWDACAAPWRARRFAVPVGEGYPRSQAGGVGETQGHPADVATAQAPWLGPADGLAWHPRGHPGAKYKAKIKKHSQQSSDVVRNILKELEKAARGGYIDTVEEARQEGGSRALPVSDEKTGAIVSKGLPGADGERNSNAADSEDFWKYCIEGVAAVLGSMLLGVVLSCIICLWWKRKRHNSPASPV